MGEGMILTLILAILTVVASIIGSIISIINKHLDDKKNRRIYPNISILDDQHDEIDKLLTDRIRWYVPLEKTDEWITRHNSYLCFQVSERYKIRDCELLLDIEDVKERHATRECSLRTLSSNRCAVVLLEEVDLLKYVTCSLSYETEYYENLVYEVKCKNKDGILEAVSETLKLKRKFGKKYKTIISKTLKRTNCYSSEDLRNKLNGRKLYKGNIK